MNAVRMAAFAIIFAAIAFINWYGDKIGHEVGWADKLPSGFGFYAIPIATILAILSVAFLLCDFLRVLLKSVIRLSTKKN